MRWSEMKDQMETALLVMGLLDAEVEVATSSRKDEWYEIADVEGGENGNGRRVLVINTD